MTDVYANDPEKQAKLEALREQADALGLKYHHRAGIPKLQEILAEGQQEPAVAAETVQSNAEVNEPAKPRVPVAGQDHMTEEQFMQEFERFNPKPTPQQEANKLVRVRIQCMNPVKKEWEGEIISAGNSVVGQVKKYIPFNNEPYHVPQIILNYLKEKKCTSFITVKDSRGNKTRKPKLIQEFAIEELPPLTNKELKELAQRQAMAAGNQDALENNELL